MRCVGVVGDCYLSQMRGETMSIDPTEAARDETRFLACRLDNLCRTAAEYLEVSSINEESQVSCVTLIHMRDAIARTRGVLSGCEFLE
mgnify:CR=1 FL=1